MAVIVTPRSSSFLACRTLKKSFIAHGKLQLGFRCVSLSRITCSCRRNVVMYGASFVSIFALMPLRVLAEEDVSSFDREGNGEDGGVVGAIQSLFDPNEKTKSGKVLPKAYLKSAREVVKTLRESLKEDTDNMAKFRRNADAAKESIREYLSTWRGQEKVVHEESYVELEKAIRALAGFYSKAGPSASLPEEVRSQILSVLNTAEEFL